ncbi:hypothetical protein BCR43DRAFT_492665 [Syncephalastrum racemosum]|uniref:Uncharacterized protein n=1 Tax=Syncephalastrum racemosum TaxID=13706 RepID=A0A1X2H997_SYNRA|nr:hypothetical protein BCR43DRAFT_492665 [Syncephalastrum racemosum]
MASFFIVAWACLFFISLAAEALKFGEQCDATPIYSSTWQYEDSCQDVYLFCDPKTNTCNYKGCTNTDYIKGWNPAVHKFPQRCPSHTYCPDASSSCQPLVPVGGQCELQRDDECAGTPNNICLNSTCYLKIAPLGGQCSSDITDYISYDAEGYAVHQRIIRDNCTTGTWCQTTTCVQAKQLGAPCEQDRECLSNTCSPDGMCINGPDVFHTVPGWLWGVLGVAVFLFVLLILIMLYFLQRYQSKKERAKLLKFFGDNEEFAKYAMLENDDDCTLPPPQQQHQISEKQQDVSKTGSRTSMVYLGTPDYNESAALGTTRPISWRHSTSATKLRSSFSPSPHGSAIFTPSGRSSTHLGTPHASTPDLHRHMGTPQP